MPQRKKPGTYYSRNKEKCLENGKRYRKNNQENVLLLSAKHRAAATGREFDLVIEDITIPDICPALGTPMKSPSIDRKDNNKGYTKDNIMVISRRANVIKSDATIEELEAILRYMKAGAG